MRRLLLVLFVLSAGYFVYGLLEMVVGLRRAERMRAQPVWASLEGPEFELRVGESGSWEPQWLPVENAVCSPTLHIDGYYVPYQEAGPRVVARVDTPDAATPFHESHASVDGEWELAGRFDFGPAVVLDPIRLRRIDWRVTSVPEAWVGRRARLAIDGDGGSDHRHEADHIELANWVGGFVCGLPSLLLTAFLGYRLWLGRARPHAVQP